MTRRVLNIMVQLSKDFKYASIGVGDSSEEPELVVYLDREELTMFRDKMSEAILELRGENEH